MSARFTHPLSLRKPLQKSGLSVLVTKYHYSSYCLHYTNWKESNRTTWGTKTYCVMSFVKTFTRENTWENRNILEFACLIAAISRCSKPPLRYWPSLEITVYLVLLGHLELFLSCHPRSLVLALLSALEAFPGFSLYFILNDQVEQLDLNFKLSEKSGSNFGVRWLNDRAKCGEIKFPFVFNAR